MGPIDQLWIRQTDTKAKDRTADRAKRGRDKECSDAKSADVHAEIFGLAGIIAQGLQMQPEGRMHDSPHQKARDHEQAETIIVKGPSKKLDLVVAFEGKPQNIHARHAHAAVAPGEMIELEQERVEQHAKGKRQHAKENSHVTRA